MLYYMTFLYDFVLLLFFFFSSRRRHTRYWRDWSSDVCSSDLFGAISAVGGSQNATTSHERTNYFNTVPAEELDLALDVLRSEERRVGKECRSRWSPYH